ncbi:MAG: Bifunctional protein GlmU [Elusimicrobia bacterium ADurb.Bin231]|nr:MAG: Bifunctional protein GlmU [Elusimicrobia bacterium ADurb.Bin231]
MLRSEDFFELKDNPFIALFDKTEYVWDALKNIKSYLKSHIQPNVSEIRRGDCFIRKTVVLVDGKILDSGFEIDSSGKKVTVKVDGSVLSGASIIFAGAFLMDNEISIGKGTIIEPGALIKGPTIICDNTEVRQGAYCRGDVLIGNNCVVGHTTELKASVMLGGSKAGHFAYIGDSILGKVNLGAGTKLANLKIVESQISLNINNKKYDTGLRKFGAILADGVETGCNSVTTPGTLLSKNVLLYPNATARGYYAPKKIVKVIQEQALSERR